MPAFRDFAPEPFLRDYWQQRPLLIRNPWHEWSNPIDPEELAGLACEPGVESRLVTQAPERWSLEHGPLPETRFAEIDRPGWTLLVQAVDHHVDAVAALLEPFRFIPNWRLDDVMVSYAADGGGVGAHFDQYDVFLVQGLGRRRWQVGARCDDSTPLLPDEDLRRLAHFEPTDEWVLEPGDMLYVPPGFAHNGVAVGDDCMTYSIGFRAPSRSELIAGWSESVLDTLVDDDRYADPGLAPQDNPGEIAAPALARLQAMVAEAMLDPDAFARWFGAFTTAPKSHELDWRPEEPVEADDLRAAAARGRLLVRNPASRFSFIRDEGNALTLFVDGVAHDCTGAGSAFAERICAAERVEVEASLLGMDDVAAMIRDLVNAGSVAFEAED
jgi:50S ribosomal protein L16 3-hydroxylase